MTSAGSKNELQQIVNETLRAMRDELGFACVNHAPCLALIDPQLADICLRHMVEGLGFRGLRFRGLGLRGLGFRGLGFRVVPPEHVPRPLRGSDIAALSL